MTIASLEIFNSAKMMKLCAVIVSVIVTVSGHGRVMDPPARSVMWRFGFNTEPNYTDMGLNCGGKDVQYSQNGGKCGICGDNFADVTPRENEDGGRYGKAVIAKTYKRGQSIPVWVELTASHKGHFEFGLCDLTKSHESEQCFQPLKLADGSSQFQILTYDAENYTIPLQLPSQVSCERCVLRWHYKTGNSQGECSDGTSSVDCADQEIFRNCVDISIH